MKYMTLSNNQIGSLDMEVNFFLKEGWKLHGNQYHVNYVFYQVMTKGDYVRPARLKEKKRDLG
jgi:hypothetical protein